MPKSISVTSVLMFLLYAALTVPFSCKKHSVDQKGPYEDSIDSDERVVFFPTDGWKSEDGNHWHLRVHGWIFEPEKDSIIRDQVSAVVESYFDDEVMNDARRKRLEKRLRYFLADNEGGKELTIRIAGKKRLLPESDGDGRFEIRIKVSAKQVEKHAKNGRLTYHAVPGNSGKERVPEGTIHLIEPKGLTVISDIDDTIKISNVHNKRKLLRNTFLKTYRPVSGMASVYQKWRRNRGARIIYLSNSPWQLYPPLSKFTSSENFPSGPFDLLRVQLDDTRLLKLFDESRHKKMPRLKPYFKRYPDRNFILVGDSGEADAGIYADLARDHPDQVKAIFIRNVTDEDPESERIQKTFKDLPKKRWTIFDDPDELKLPE